MKVELEVREIRRWWIRPAVLQPVSSLGISLATAIVSVLAAVIGYYNGWFSTKLDSLKNQEFTVQQKINELKGNQSILSVENRGLRAENRNVKAENTRLQTENAKVREDDANMRAENVKLRTGQLEAANEAQRLQPKISELHFTNPAERESQSRIVAALGEVQKAAGVFSGRIVDSEGHGLAGVTVEVFPLFGGKEVARPVTNANGDYTLTLSPDVIREIQFANSSGQMIGGKPVLSPDSKFVRLNCTKDGYYYAFPGRISEDLNHSNWGAVKLFKNGTLPPP